eukprot:3400712-Pleurochrysis_carterae.AAC.3
MSGIIVCSSQTSDPGLFQWPILTACLVYGYGVGTFHWREGTHRSNIRLRRLDLFQPWALPPRVQWKKLEMSQFAENEPNGSEMCRSAHIDICIDTDHVSSDSTKSFVISNRKCTI